MWAQTALCPSAPRRFFLILFFLPCWPRCTVAVRYSTASGAGVARLFFFCPSSSPPPPTTREPNSHWLRTLAIVYINPPPDSLHPSPSLFPILRQGFLLPFKAASSPTTFPFSHPYLSLLFKMAGGAVADVGFTPAGPVARPASVKQSLPAILVAAASAFGGVLFGYDTGTISGLIVMRTSGDFRQACPGSTTGAYALTTNDESLVVSILSAGTFVVPWPVRPSRISLVDDGVCRSLCCFHHRCGMQMATTDLGVFIGGRVVAGLGVGILSTIVPMYQSENAPRWIRGAVVSVTSGPLLLVCFAPRSPTTVRRTAMIPARGASRRYPACLCHSSLRFLPDSS